MRRFVTALSAGLVVLAFVATSASAAKPPSGVSATLAITSTGASTCTGTLTVSWSSIVQGPGGVTGVTWSADASDTGTLTFASGGSLYSPPKKSGSVQVGFTLSAGTGEADVVVQGSTFKLPTIYSNSVTCTPIAPDLTITGISRTVPSGYPTPWSYAVTVKNIGTVTADVTNAVVQGYWTSSTDTSIFPPPGGSPSIPGGDPACGTIMQPFATSLAPGASVDVVVGCGGTGPTASADTNLMVGVDVTNIVAESNESNNVAVIPLT
jgi:hypothetical protein